MALDLFKYLPSEMLINILSRLPVRTVVTSKCVCKPWLDLLESDEFVKSHFAKSVPTLVVLKPDRELCTIFDLEEEIDVDESQDRRYNPITKFVLPHSALMVGSVNGFLCLRKRDRLLDVVYICNPIPREYIELRHPRGFDINNPDTEEVTYGFGRSKITGKHKVLRILHNFIYNRRNMFRGSNSITKIECDVYTLETGSWKSVEVGALLDFGICGLCGLLSFGAFVNGCLHWIVSDLNDTLSISCFDLETECFSTFLVPPPFQGRRENVGDLCVLKDSLCLCDTQSDHEIVIWSMKECGLEKSWNKEYVIAYNRYLGAVFPERVYPIKVLKDGDILILFYAQLVYYYSSKTKTTLKIHISDERPSCMNVMLLTPSFLSLKSFGMEEVFSF